jgi:hypothetical protein
VTELTLTPEKARGAIEVLQPLVSTRLWTYSFQGKRALELALLALRDVAAPAEADPGARSALEEFAREHSLRLAVEKHSPERWTVRFERCEVKQGKMLAGLYGDASSEAEARADYQAKIAGRLLVVDAHKPTRREVRAPATWRSVMTTYDPAAKMLATVVLPAPAAASAIDQVFRDIAAKGVEALPVDEAMPCRRCAECEGQEHHWLMPECTNEDGTPCEPFVPCKHCDARAGLCGRCCDGVIFPVAEDRTLCDACLQEDAPHVCPGCHAVGAEPHAGYCPDAAIERAREASATDAQDDDGPSDDPPTSSQRRPPPPGSAASDEQHVAAYKLIETYVQQSGLTDLHEALGTVEGAIAALTEMRRNYDALVPADGLPGFGVDPKDSVALLELRQAVDDYLGWETLEQEEAADYAARVRQVGKHLEHYRGGHCPGCDAPGCTGAPPAPDARDGGA